VIFLSNPSVSTTDETATLSTLEMELNEIVDTMFELARRVYEVAGEINRLKDRRELNG
jgi:hypothetical protein